MRKFAIVTFCMVLVFGLGGVAAAETLKIGTLSPEAEYIPSSFEDLLSLTARSFFESVFCKYNMTDL